MTKPCGASSVATTTAPHGSVRLKNSTSSRVRSFSGGVPLETVLGSAKYSAAPATSPRRSVSAQARITSSAPASGVAAGSGTAPPPPAAGEAARRPVARRLVVVPAEAAAGAERERRRARGR